MTSCNTANIVLLFFYFQNVNPNQRTTSPSHELTINYSSSQRQSISVPNSSKQYPYDSSSISSSPQMPASSTPIKPNTLNIKMSMIQQQQQATNKELSNEPISGDLSARGRDRKKTTIFGTLRKRLSRSKTRNDENGALQASSNMNTTNGYNSLASPNSLDSNKDNSLKNSLKSPGSTFSSKIGISGSSRRSSISEMSNLSRMSNISNKTFLHEASSLVLEVIENGVKR